MDSKVVEDNTYDADHNDLISYDNSERNLYNVQNNDDKADTATGDIKQSDRAALRVK